MRFTGTFSIAVLVTPKIVAVTPIQLPALPFEFLGASGLIVARSRFPASGDGASVIEWVERIRDF